MERASPDRTEAKDELDAKLGMKSEISTGRKDSRILYTLDDCEIKDRRDLWPTYIDWQLKTTVALRKAVRQLGL